MSLFYKVNQTKYLQSYACPNNEPSKIWAQQGPWRGKVIIKHNIGLVNLGYKYFPLDFIKILPCGLLCGKVPVFWSKLKPNGKRKNRKWLPKVMPKVHDIVAMVQHIKNFIKTHRRRNVLHYFQVLKTLTNINLHHPGTNNIKLFAMA